MSLPDTPMPDEEIAARLDDLRRRLEASQPSNIGFPSTLDLDCRDLWPFFSTVMNNVGDPYQPNSAFPAHCKEIERDVVDIVADLLRAPDGDRWGYVTTGGSEGTVYGLLLARTRYPDGIVYFSTGAHFSVAKAAGLLGLTSVVVKAGAGGEMDYADLRTAVYGHRDRPAIVVASVGTTMTEALDDVGSIRDALAEIPVRRAYIHADAALSGVLLALLPVEERPRFDFTAGADSISVSGHKFIGSPFPCGIVVTRRGLRAGIGTPVDYLNVVDATIGGSRSGHTPLVLWYALHRLGLDGLRRRAEEALSVAWYTVDHLTRIGWPAWRHRHALTVVLDSPPPGVLRRWALATSDGTSHLVCMPGISRQQIDAFITDLVACRTGNATAMPDPARDASPPKGGRVPPPRRPRPSHPAPASATI